MPNIFDDILPTPGATAIAEPKGNIFDDIIPSRPTLKPIGATDDYGRYIADIIKKQIAQNQPQAQILRQEPPERPVLDRLLAFTGAGTKASLPGMIGEAVNKPLVSGRDIEKAIRKYPGFATAGSIVGGAPSYVAPTIAGVPPALSFGILGTAREALRQKEREANRSLVLDKPLNIAQKGGRLATAGALNALTGQIFKEADAYKTVLTRILAASLGSGANTVTEEIVKEAISGENPDLPNILLNAAVQAGTIGVSKALFEIPALRKIVWEKAREVAKTQLVNKPKLETYDQALALLRKEGIEPEQLSPVWQQAKGHKSYQERVGEAEKYINKIAKDQGWDKNIVKKVMADRNKRQLLEGYYNWLYHEGQRAGIYQAQEKLTSPAEKLIKETVEQGKAKTTTEGPKLKPIITPKEEPAGMALKLKDGTVVIDPTAKLHSDIITNKGINPDNVQDVGWVDPSGVYTATKKPDTQGGEVLDENLPEVPEEVIKKAQDLVKPEIGKSYKVVWADGRGVQYFDNLKAAEEFAQGADSVIGKPELIDTPKGVRVKSVADLSKMPAAPAVDTEAVWNTKYQPRQGVHMKKLANLEAMKTKAKTGDEIDLLQRKIDQVSKIMADFEREYVKEIKTTAPDQVEKAQKFLADKKQEEMATLALAKLEAMDKEIDKYIDEKGKMPHKLIEERAALAAQYQAQFAIQEETPALAEEEPVAEAPKPKVKKPKVVKEEPKEEVIEEEEEEEEPIGKSYKESDSYIKEGLIPVMNNYEEEEGYLAPDGQWYEPEQVEEVVEKGEITYIKLKPNYKSIVKKHEKREKVKRVDKKVIKEPKTGKEFSEIVNAWVETKGDREYIPAIQAYLNKYPTMINSIPENFRFVFEIKPTQKEAVKEAVAKEPKTVQKAAKEESKAPLVKKETEDKNIRRAPFSKLDDGGDIGESYSASNYPKIKEPFEFEGKLWINLGEIHGLDSDYDLGIMAYEVVPKEEWKAPTLIAEKYGSGYKKGTILHTGEELTGKKYVLTGKEIIIRPIEETITEETVKNVTKGITEENLNKALGDQEEEPRVEKPKTAIEKLRAKATEIQASAPLPKSKIPGARTSKIKSELDVVALAVNKKNTLPIIHNINFSGNKVYATDLDIMIIYTADKDMGKISLDAEHLKGEFLQNIKAIPGKKNMVQIGNLQAQGMDISEAPEIPKLEKPKLSVELNTARLIDILTRFIPYAAEDETRLPLTGIYMQFSPGEIRFTATDGKRLIDEAIQVKTDKKLNILFPATAAKKLIKVLNASKTPNVKFEAFDKQAGITSGKYQFITRLIEGEFPDYKVVILKKKDTYFQVNTADLYNLVKSIPKNLYHEDYIAVKLTIEKDKLVLVKTVPEKGTYTQSIPLKAVSSPGGSPQQIVLPMRIYEDKKETKEIKTGNTFGINPYLLIDAMASTPTPIVVIGYDNPEKPICFYYRGPAIREERTGELSSEETIASLYTRQEIEEMLERFWQSSGKDFYDSKAEWLNMDADHIAMEVESYSELYFRYFRRLPEDISPHEVIQAYKDGLLPERERYRKPLYIERGLIEDIAVNNTDIFWQPPAKPTEDYKVIYEEATKRLTKDNSASVLNARKDLFILWNTDKDLAEKLDISKTELNRQIKQYTGVNVGASELENRLNEGVPEQFQWVGISNSSWITKQGIGVKDVDKFVKKIITKEKGKGFYGDQGEWLRHYIINAFLGIDIRLLYSDLTFLVKSLEKANGKYDNSKILIIIDDINQHTVAHEIGHYLDYKWAREFGFSSGSLSEIDTPNWDYLKEKGNIKEEHITWAKKFYDFVMNISERSEIRSEYYQKRAEVFARFTDRFLQWVNEKSGARRYQERILYVSDQFNENDYYNFIKLLQEKAYLDEKYGIKSLVDKGEGGVELDMESELAPPAKEEQTIGQLSYALRGMTRAKLIEELTRRIKEKAMNPVHLKNYIFKHFGVDNPYGLSNKDLRRLIRRMEQEKAYLENPAIKLPIDLAAKSQALAKIAKEKGLVYTDWEGNTHDLTPGIIRAYPTASLDQLKEYVSALTGDPENPPHLLKMSGDIGKDTEIIKLLKEASGNWIDINHVEIYTLDPIRVIEKVTQADSWDNNILADNVFNLFAAADDAMYDRQVKELKDLDDHREEVNKKSKESAEIMRKFEAGTPLNAKEQRIVDYLRRKNDALIAEANEIRKAAHKKPIPYRKDYMTHLREQNLLSDFFKGDMDKMDTISQAQLDAIRKGDYTKGNMPFNRFALRRSGPKTKYDAIGNYEVYLKTILKEIYYTPAITHVRKFIEYALSKQPNAYKALDRMLNDLKGKVSIVDQNLLGAIASSKPVKWTRIRIAKNALIGNINFWLINASNFTTSFDELGTYMIKGMRQFLGNKKWRKFAFENSKMLKARTIDPDVDPTKFKLAEEVAGYITNLLEYNNVGSTFVGAYFKGIAEGYSEEKAILYADAIARRCQVGYKKYEMNAYMRSNSGMLLSQFQTWSFNMMNHLIYDLKLGNIPQNLVSKITGKEVKPVRWGAFFILLVTSMLVNLLYKKMKLRRPYEISAAMPKIPYVTSARYEEPGPTRIVRDIATAFTGKKPETRYKAGVRAVTSVALPYGGTQVGRFLTGKIVPEQRGNKEEATLPSLSHAANLRRILRNTR